MTAQQGAPVLAADIGGTKIMTALFSAGGKMLARDVRPTLANEGVRPVIERLCSAIDKLLDSNNLKPSRLGSIGIACAGGIDSGRGVVVTPSPNMTGWVDIPLADIIRERFKSSTFVVNDASAAAFGEHRYGAGRGVNNLVLLTLGTGIGGGIIASGELYLGAVGAAAELGHMTVDADGPKCGCGNTGCLEMLASGRAVERDAVKRIKRGEKASLSETVRGKTEKITAEMVGAAAKNGDPLALDVLSRAAYYLGIGMVNVVNIFNPEMIVLGGGMAGLGDLFIDPGRKMVTERAFPISSRAVRIVTAQLGNEAGVYGAAAFALEQSMRRTA
ncbi:MAG TPA: ROK family protein [Dehalococcoidales bacterium]|nr:ROK family protein [Dehalococcoidales bacterium]